jgi:uncharacterized protein YbjT (DUF2867 family)
LQGVQVAYYLVHSMGSRRAFDEEDRRAARHFGQAARDAGVQRLIYLGGLGDRGGRLSPHLQSRQEVGEILRTSGVQTLEFRASIVIGSGSLSFDMIRALVERLPIMMTPRWVSIHAQPIAITDLVQYLLAALGLAVEGHPIFEIGGADRMSYRDLMREYARQRGLCRLMIPVPVLTPRLSSLWLGLVTPLYARVGRQLIESMRHPTVVHEASALQRFGIQPKGVREAIALALRHEDRELAQTRWSDALSVAGPRRDWGAYASAVDWWTPASPTSMPRRRRHLRPSAASAGPPAGIMATGCGGCAGAWMSWWGAWGCAAGGAPSTRWSSVMRSTAGAWRRLSRIVGCDWPPR